MVCIVTSSLSGGRNAVRKVMARFCRKIPVAYAASQDFINAILGLLILSLSSGKKNITEGLSVSTAREEILVRTRARPVDIV
jgi:hypothetical protein